MEFLSDTSTYLVVAILGTALFLLKLVLSLVSGDLDADLEHGHHDGHSSEDSFVWFTVQSALSFIMGLGWAGYVLEKGGYNWLLVLLLGTVFGVFCAALNTFAMFAIKKAESTSKYDLSATIGQEVHVILTIPPKGEGSALVRVTIGVSTDQVKAVSDEETAIPSHSRVKVVEVQGSSTVLVKKLS